MNIYHVRRERYCRFYALQASLLTHLNSIRIDFIHGVTHRHRLG